MPAASSTARRDCLDRLDRRPGEDRQQLEQPLLGGVQQLVAPLDRRPERLLPLRQVAGAAAERLEAARQAVPQRLGREEVEAGGRELDRQRQPVEPAADVGHGGGVVVGQAEVGPDAARPLDEQLDRLELAQLRGRRLRGRRGRQRQRRHRDDVLAAHAERLAARHEQLETRAVGEELDEDRRRDGDLLEVVEHEQDLLSRGVAGGARRAATDRTRRRAPTAVAISARTASASVAVTRSTKKTPSREPVDLVGGGPDREARLAGPAGPGERDEADVGVVEALADGAELGVPADERRCLGRQVVRPEVEGRQRRELRRQRRMAELEHALRLARGPSADARRDPAACRRPGAASPTSVAVVSDSRIWPP